jgi:hypothetical protein
LFGGANIGEKWKSEKTTCIILAYALKEQKYRSGKVAGGTKTVGKYIY